MSTAPEPAAGRARLPGVDLARALALLAMLDAHAYDGWVRSGARTGPAFALTRAVATLALPAFLLLAGVSLALRAHGAAARGEPLARVRRGLVMRGARLVLAGYALSAGCAVLDGGLRLDTVLRADVLHAIGLSLALLAGLGLREPRAGDNGLRSLARAAAVLGLLAWLSCPWLSRLGGRLGGPVRYAAALFIDVPGVTRMPVVPLLAWASAGVLLGLSLARLHGDTTRVQGWALRAGLPSGLLACALGAGAQSLLGASLALVPARTNVGIYPNALELGGRALLLLVVATWLAPRLGPRLRAPLLAMGRHSLLLYVAHLPFCYGRLARPFARALSLPQASLGVLLLLFACAALALGLERARRVRAARPARLLA